MLPFRLSPYERARVDLWRNASVELSIGRQSSDPLVQAAVEAVLAWLRSDAETPRALLDLYERPHGPLGAQLHLVGTLLHPEEPPTLGPPRLCWWVVKCGYYRRWRELTHFPA
jgi:hypothetical protein